MDFAANSLVIWEGRGPWKIVADQRLLGARRRAASVSEVGGIVFDEMFSAQSTAPSANRTDVLLDRINQFFKDNPTWE